MQFLQLVMECKCEILIVKAQLEYILYTKLNMCFCIQSQFIFKNLLKDFYQRILKMIC